jgi:hypothetical protein
MASARTIVWNAARVEIGVEILLGTDTLLNSGPFLLRALNEKSDFLSVFQLS